MSEPSHAADDRRAWRTLRVDLLVSAGGILAFAVTVAVVTTVFGGLRSSSGIALIGIAAGAWGILVERHKLVTAIRRAEPVPRSVPVQRWQSIVRHVAMRYAIVGLFWGALAVPFPGAALTTVFGIVALLVAVGRLSLVVEVRRREQTAHVVYLQAPRRWWEEDRTVGHLP